MKTCLQSKLPDVNQAIVKHRGDAITGFLQKNYNMTIISLDSIIALLPEEYKVEVNTEKYEMLSKETNMIFCEECQEDIPRNIIKTFDLDFSYTMQIILNKKSRRVWICPKCDQVSDMEGSKFKTKKFQDPFYLKIIPSPPVRKGLLNRHTFDSEFAKWFDIALSEIESQIGIYRADYAAQQSDDGLKELEEE